MLVLKGIFGGSLKISSENIFVLVLKGIFGGSLKII